MTDSNVIEEEHVELGLDEILNILNSEKEKLWRLKNKLDKLLEIVKNVYEEESNYKEKLCSAKTIYNYLGLLFHGAKIKDLEEIGTSLSKHEQELKKKTLSLINELNSRQFSWNNLEYSYSSILKFLQQQEQAIENIMNDGNKVFEKAVNKIKEKFTVFNRLIDALIRRVKRKESSTQLEEVLNEELNKVQQIIAKIPSKIENLVKMEENEVKELYNKAKRAISSSKEKVKQLAIQNKLLSENEIAVLEAIYELKISELEIHKAIEALKDKLRLSEEKVKDTLICLSKEGFLTIRLIVE